MLTIPYSYHINKHVDDSLRTCVETWLLVELARGLIKLLMINALVFFSSTSTM